MVKQSKAFEDEFDRLSWNDGSQLRIYHAYIPRSEKIWLLKVNIWQHMFLEPILS
jgi:hypothetical protein